MRVPEVTKRGEEGLSKPSQSDGGTDVGHLETAEFTSNCYNFP